MKMKYIVLFVWGMVVLVCLAACEQSSSLPTETRQQSATASYTMTPTFTASPTKIPPTITKTRTPLPSPTVTKTALPNLYDILPNGQYLLCISAKDQHILGVATDGNAYQLTDDFNPWFKRPLLGEISFDGQYSAYVDTNQKWIVFNLRDETKTYFTIPSGYYFNEHNSYFAWSPDNKKLVINVSAVMDHRTDKMLVLSFPEGELLAEIPMLKEIPEPKGPEYSQIRWSPDGQWLGFEIFVGDGTGRWDGIYIIPASCLSQSETCSGQMNWLINYDEVGAAGEYSWTHKNQIGFLFIGNVDIYSMSTGEIIQQIMSSSWYTDSISMWSPDGIWLGIGANMVNTETGQTNKISEECGSILRYWIQVVH